MNECRKNYKYIMDNIIKGTVVWYIDGLYDNICEMGIFEGFEPCPFQKDTDCKEINCKGQIKLQDKKSDCYMNENEIEIKIFKFPQFIEEAEFGIC